MLKNKKYSLKIYYALTALLFFMTAIHAQAGYDPEANQIMKKLKQVAAGTGTSDANAPYAFSTGIETLGNILGAIIFWFMSLLGVIFLGFMIFAGYLWLTARGNKEQTDKARKILTDSIIGMAIVLGAAAITSIIYLAFLS